MRELLFSLLFEEKRLQLDAYQPLTPLSHLGFSPLDEGRKPASSEPQRRLSLVRN